MSSMTGVLWEAGTAYPLQAPWIHPRYLVGFIMCCVCMFLPHPLPHPLPHLVFRRRLVSSTSNLSSVPRLSFRDCPFDCNAHFPHELTNLRSIYCHVLFYDQTNNFIFNAAIRSLNDFFLLNWNFIHFWVIKDCVVFESELHFIRKLSNAK